MEQAVQELDDQRLGRLLLPAGLQRGGWWWWCGVGGGGGRRRGGGGGGGGVPQPREGVEEEADVLSCFFWGYYY